MTPNVPYDVLAIVTFAASSFSHSPQTLYADYASGMKCQSEWQAQYNAKCKPSRSYSLLILMKADAQPDWWTGRK
jgi:hypothetical protein